MIVYKCKMCGGDLSIVEGSKIATCEYCMTQQAIPSADDEKKANMYNRANHFRQNGEFDRAMGIYEQILSDEAQDAEVYWEVVLCKFGIQYVEDPATKERKPTVNRTQTASILGDPDYQKALELADVAQRRLFGQEAMEIERIQKEILSIAKSEEPYDIFISYKEKAKDGNRTTSSVIAQNIYDRLTKEGYRVFFSRITLEEVIGRKYEPYIYSALNSAKVMLVVGTNKEEFEAPWVRNEWSRFLNMMRGNLDKFLIPCFRDMDAYDLPEEFQTLQAQDMSRVGFEQDLLRGIGKIIKVRQSQEQTHSPVAMDTKMVSASNFKGKHAVDRLIENASTLMSLGDFDAAYGTYTDITKNYPEEWMGWWGLIRACTDDLQLIDPKSIIPQKAMLNGWFKNARQLATEEQFETPLNLYREYWKKVASRLVLADAEQVKGIIKKHERKKKEIEGELESVKNKMIRESKTYEDQMENAIESIRIRQDENRRLKAFITMYWLFLLAGWLLLAGPWVGLIIYDKLYKPTGSAPSSVGDFVMVSTLTGIALLIISKIMAKTADENKGKVRSNRESIVHQEEHYDMLQDSEIKIKQEYMERQKTIQKQISDVQGKIVLCQNYLKMDPKALEDFAYATLSSQFGEKNNYDQRLREMRNRVMAG